MQFCRSPRRAPDLVLPEMAELVGTGRSQVTRPLRMVHWREDVRTFAGHLKRGELKTMVRKAGSRVRMVVARTLVPFLMTDVPTTVVVVFVDGDERRWLATVQDLAPSAGA